MAKRTLVFMENRNQISNTLGDVSPIGELSTYTRTFSNDLRVYDNVNYDYLSLIVLSNVINDTETNIDPGIKNTIFIIFARAISFIEAITGPIDIAAMKNYILEVSTVSNLEIGPIVTGINDVRGPEYISFKTSDQVPTDITIWYSDEALKDQYPILNTIVVPSLPDITQLRDTYANLLQLENQIDVIEVFDRIETIRNDNPETRLIPLEAIIHAVDDTSKTIKFIWYVLVYGPHGNHESVIRNAIAQYIEEQDPDNIQEWRDVVAPEIFSATEFYMFPKWDNPSIPNLTDEEGYYSPIVNIQDSIGEAIISLPEYAEADIRAMSETVVSHYKSIGILAVAGFGNIEGKRSLAEVLPTYIPISSTDPDFVRMNTHSQGWTRFITDLLVSAEDRYTDRNIDTDIREIVRDGIEYFIATYDHVEYLVKLKPGE